MLLGSPHRPRTLSAPDAFVRVTQRLDGTLLFVAPRPQPFQELGRAVGRMTAAVGAFLLPSFRQLASAVMETERVLARAHAAMATPAWAAFADDPVRVAGLEARYYARAAMDDRYAGPDQLARLVQALVAGDAAYDPDLRALSAESLRVVAVAAMRGWESRGERLTSWWCGDLCGEGDAVGMPYSCSPALRWRCERYNPPQPPLIAFRQWGSTRVEVRCG